VGLLPGVLLGGGLVLDLGALGHLALDVLDAVGLRNLVVFEVHFQLVRDVHDLLHCHPETLGHLHQVEPVHFTLYRLQLPLLFVYLVQF